MFVDVVGAEGQDIAGTKRETRVGVDSKYNLTEAKLVVRNLQCILMQHNSVLTLNRLRLPEFFI